MERFDYPELGEALYKDTLPNGLQILLVPRPGFRRKLAYFVTDYGAIHRNFTLNEESWKTPAGVAHFLEHKLFDLPDRDVTAEFAALGASPNAFTSYDMTAYYFSCTENFESCLSLLLDFVSTPYFTEESVQKELGIIGQEIGMNEDNPDARIFEQLMQCMYPDHGIREPILGSREAISRITPQILTACHNAFYRPGNMLLCVVGDVDPDQVRQLALAHLPKEDTVRVTRESQPGGTMECSESKVCCQMEVAMPMFQLGFKAQAPEKGFAAARMEAVGDLAAEALFGESSALYLRLYEDGIIDGSFGGGFETVEGMAMLTASGDSDQPELILEKVLEEAERIVKEGIPAGDFLRMKRSALGRRIRDLDSFDATAFRLCAYHFSDFDYFRFPEVYRAVEVSEIQMFLQQVVTRQRCALSVIYPNT